MKALVDKPPVLSSRPRDAPFRNQAQIRTLPEKTCWRVAAPDAIIVRASGDASGGLGLANYMKNIILSALAILFYSIVGLLYALAIIRLYLAYDLFSQAYWLLAWMGSWVVRA